MKIGQIRTISAVLHLKMLDYLGFYPTCAAKFIHVWDTVWVKAYFTLSRHKSYSCYRQTISGTFPDSLP